ncbi:protein APEM9 [Rutidosis leptorrhynchoides]|uniref:protein APEM9 n=1 Tax=Rutidosis leptorrhynchoides TaxID=125765 RepID=UPI003A9A4D3E
MAAESGVNQSIKDTEIVTTVEIRPIWDEIDLAESYLVCSMFEEASSLASRILKRLRDKEYVVDDIELNDMFESAGMVFVQSFKELGRTSEIVNELTQLYGSLIKIPVQVFLAGVCFQMQENSGGAQKVLKEFLSKWRLVDEQHYILENQGANTSKGCDNQSVITVDIYLQVVEAYITLLTGILRETNIAISWVEKAALPEDIRQDLLRRLRSMHSSKDTRSQASTSALLSDENGISSVSLKNENEKQLNGDDAAKQAILRYSGQHVSTFWWFRTVNLKLGGLRFAVSNGSIFLTTLFLLTYYFLRRKKYTITSILKGPASFVKKTAIDLWQLAFAYQVNPLAAVEPIQNTTRISR